MKKGFQDERNLVTLLWKKGFAVLRAPSSGSSTKMPRPDILAGNKKEGLLFAIEVKTTKKDTIYIRKDSIEKLVVFSEIFGCDPIVAIKFKGKRKPWIFLDIEKLWHTKIKNYKINFNIAFKLGVNLENLDKIKDNYKK